MTEATITIPPRINVLGVGIHTTNPTDAVATLLHCATSKRKGYVCVTGVHGVMESQKDDELRTIHNRSLLTVPDGMPLTWIGRIQRHRTMQRTYGPDLMANLCEAGIQQNATHFLYGGNDGIVEELKASLEQKFSGIKIVGSYTPPFRPLNTEEEQDLSQQVSAAEPDFLWVGLSTPKQERFMATHQHLDATIMLGVGAAFDLHTGHMIDSPSWMKAAGLQWLHRLCQEPRRLWKRYLTNNPRFVWNLFLQATRIRSYSIDKKRDQN